MSNTVMFILHHRVYITQRKREEKKGSSIKQAVYSNLKPTPLAWFHSQRSLFAIFPCHCWPTPTSLLTTSSRIHISATFVYMFLVAQHIVQRIIACSTLSYIDVCFKASLHFLSHNRPKAHHPPCLIILL